MPTLSSAPRPTNRAALQPLVLVVSGGAAEADERHGARPLMSALAGRGYRAVFVGLALSTLARGLGHTPSLVILDWRRAELDGVSLTARIRCETGAPLLVLLDAERERSRAALLEAGASECLVGLSVGEQVLRVGDWLARAAAPPPFSVKAVYGSAPNVLRLDPDRRAVVVDGVDVHVTPLEYRLVSILLENHGALASEDGLCEALWKAPAIRRGQSLRTLLRHIRQKIERDPSRPTYLVGSPRSGYRLTLR
ncbi:MAG TPA: winged helix-turn-helix domain-containing protein [Polyangiaceae bacterium]|jgi:two-component system KDP operon response regulator KdpE|nr:winged helix-turn-helix domain-containing protein [Polyangiaceae bacterium]